MRAPVKVISFCMYGEHPKYLLGMVENLRLARQFYPGWQVWVYIPATHSTGFRRIVHDLLELKIDEVFCQGTAFPPMFWRFLPADEPHVSRFIVRDSDSRLSGREARAVQEWIESGKPFHSMIDHPAHTGRGINGGMWGTTAGVLPHMRTTIHEWLLKHPHDDPTGYGMDQIFLDEMLWPWVKNNTLVHHYKPELFPHQNVEVRPFPTKRDRQRFVGEVWEITEDGKQVPREGDYQQIPLED